MRIGEEEEETEGDEPVGGRNQVGSDVVEDEREGRE